MSSPFHFSKAMAELAEINTWFQSQDIDLEEGLKKLKRGQEIIKQCRDRLKNIENEFTQIKEDLSDDGANSASSAKAAAVTASVSGRSAVTIDEDEIL
jgi:exodeoxyribonuclease VII small subunit